MPVYQNTTDGALPFPSHEGRVEAGLTVSRQKYVWPVPAGFELIDEDGARAPWTTLVNGVIPGEAITSLAQYRQIKVTNKSGADLNVHANGDTVNAGGTNLMVLVDGEVTVIENTVDTHGMRDFNSLTFTGSGAGEIKVTGLMGV